MAAIDAAYATVHGVEAIVNAASVRFFARSGHSFVAERVDAAGGAACVGFVFAHAVWRGDRAAVQTARLAVADGAGTGASDALVAALTKSAYDSGVYDLTVAAPRSDASFADALRMASFREVDVVTFARTLGSRGAAGGGVTNASVARAAGGDEHG
ncbi:MAG: DUF1999 family protein [Trueperaceae bacterium]